MYENNVQEDMKRFIDNVEIRISIKFLYWWPILSLYYRYKRNGGKYWKNFINTKGEEWARMNLDWFHSFSPENRLVTFYDELLSKPLAVLKTILEFLQVILYLFIIRFYEGTCKEPVRHLKVTLKAAGRQLGGTREEPRRNLGGTREENGRNLGGTMKAWTWIAVVN